MRRNFSNSSKEDIIFDIFNHAFMFMVLMVVIFPLYFIIIASISDPVLVNLGKVWFFPKGFTLEGYKAIFKNGEVFLGYRNSIFYTVAGTAINLFATLTAAYPLSRKDLRFRGFFIGFILLTLYFSGGLIPTFLLIKNMGMYNTVWPLLLLGAVNVTNLIIARTFFQTTIPGELLESAKIDGCTNIRFFASIVLPLSKAIVAVLAIYYAVNHWNQYFQALIYLKDRDLFPLQITLRKILLENVLQDSEVLDFVANADKVVDNSELIKYGLIVVASVPVMILYPWLQKYFLKGVMIGAVKG